MATRYVYPKSLFEHIRNISKFSSANGHFYSNKNGRMYLSLVNVMSVIIEKYQSVSL